jgi:DNA-directed RNA polymerase specialized sigma24 family protein
MIDHKQGTNRSEAARVFQEHRGLVVSVAYRVLGSVTEAEDAVQEAWLRWSRVERSEVADPRQTSFFVRRVGGDFPNVVQDMNHVAGTPAAS